MEAQELIQKAKSAILTGDKTLAANLAQQALDLDPKNLDALLVMAGVSDPQASLVFLNKVLEQDPDNLTARQALHWAGQALRKRAAASWTPEASPAASPAPAVPSGPRPRSPLGVAMGLAVVALLFFMAYATNLGPAIEAFFRPRPAATTPQPTVNILALAQATLTSMAQNQAPATPELPPAVTEPQLTGTSLPQVFPTETALPQATAVLSPEPAASQAPIDVTLPSATPEPPQTSEPVPEFDLTSGLPIIQITPIAYLTAPDPTRNPDEIPVVQIQELAYVEEEYTAPAYTQPLGTKWIDVDLSAQMLHAYEGDTAVASFWVSTGLPDTPTVTGRYYVYIKLPSTRMTGPGYDLPNVPYTMYFYKGYGIHGTYWHNNFGTPMSHGCVNMETSNAAWLYDWAYVGILVNVHY